jgi:hypothetical protein
MRYIILYFSIFLSFALFAKTPKLFELLSLSPGSVVVDIPNFVENKSFVYEMEVKDQKLISLNIDLKDLPPFEKYLKKKQQGYCISKIASEHNIYTKRFFINKEKTKRYEITPKSQIKTIVIFDLKDVDEKDKCRLETLLNYKPQKIIESIK